MSKTKAGGSTNRGRDSAGQRLGVKRFGGQPVEAGSIIVRQRGTTMAAGNGTLVGRDHTIYAAKSGIVGFTQKRRSRFTGQGSTKTIITID